MAKKEKEKVVEAKVEEIRVESAEEAANPEIISSRDEESINISDEVVAQIAGRAAQSVRGVVSLSANGIGEMVGIKTKGIKVQVGAKDTVIDVSLTVEYGARIPDVAWEVQNKVKTEVEMMTGLNVVAVNVHVQGISDPKKKVEVAGSNQASIEESKEAEVETETEEPNK